MYRAVAAGGSHSADPGKMSPRLGRLFPRNGGLTDFDADCSCAIIASTTTF